MKLLVDAQLPRRLVTHLRQLGFEAQHTWGLDCGNRTSDETISQIADREQAIVVTKDVDFVNSHILKASPRRLLLISTGNISNRTLLELFDRHMGAIESALKASNLVELNQQGLVIH